MNQLLAHAADVESLDDIHDLIHDRFFSISAISHDTVERVLRIPFADGVGTATFCRAPDVIVPPCSVLEIACVQNFWIRDTESIGMYDFNELVWHPERRIIEIKTCVPLTFRVLVDKLSVSVTHDAG